MYRIGIDLGGTNIVAGVVDEAYGILATARCKTATPRPADAILADMAAIARQAAENAGLSMEDIAAIGVGSPGICNAATGVVERANNLGFHFVPVAEKLAALLGKEVHLENDANAAAYGELLAGAARGKRSCVCVTLGTGVGGGVVVDGRIMAGFNFAGAELGHTVIVAGGELCNCGRRGCWETYASATALIRQTKQAMDAHPESVMWNLSENGTNINGRTAFDAMRLGDPVAAQVVDTYLRYVSCGLINMINIFQPEVICIGGGICHEGETLLAPLRRIAEVEDFNRRGTHRTEIKAAQLGNDAGIIGAAFLGQ